MVLRVCSAFDVLCDLSTSVGLLGFIRCQSCECILRHLLDINSRSQEFFLGELWDQNSVSAE